MESKSKELYSMRGADFLKKGLENMIEYFKIRRNIHSLKDFSILEIGSYSGESSEIFAKKFGVVVCVDPFIDDYDNSDDTCNYAKMEKVEKAFDEKVKSFNNVVKIKSTSDEFFQNFETNSLNKFDLVYIDGLHTEEQVTLDILNSLKVLNQPMFISGHDYSKENFPGVVKAINETIGIPDKVFEDTSWIKRI